MQKYGLLMYGTMFLHLQHIQSYLQYFCGAGLSKRFPPSPDYEEPVPTSASGFRTDPSLETEVIFALPQLQLKLVTEHVQAVSEPSAPDTKRPPVLCSFLAEVLHPVCITVDVEAIEFVREVILGYINEFKKGALF